MFSARYFNRCHNVISTAGNKILRKSPVIHNLQLSRVRALNTPNDIHQKQGSYEGPGKTTVSILNEEYAGVVNLIDSFAVDGFRLNDNTKILGPCVVFPTQVLCKLTSRLIMGSSKVFFSQYGTSRVQRILPKNLFHSSLYWIPKLMSL